jgi:hypothetical protein
MVGPDGNNAMITEEPRNEASETGRCKGFTLVHRYSERKGVALPKSSQVDQG